MFVFAEYSDLLVFMPAKKVRLRIVMLIFPPGDFFRIPFRTLFRGCAYPYDSKKSLWLRLTVAAVPDVTQPHRSRVQFDVNSVDRFGRISTIYA